MSEYRDIYLSVAAEYGHICMIKRFFTECYREFPITVFDKVASNGHLDIVKWPISKGINTVSSNAIDLAASNGHFYIVRWLHQNTEIKCSSKGVDEAILNGFYHIADWLMKVRNISYSNSVMKIAAEIGRFDIVRWVYRRSCVEIAPEIFNYAIDHNSLYFFQIRRIITDGFMFRAVMCNRLDIIKYLYQKDKCSLKTIKQQALTTKSTDILDWVESEIKKNFFETSQTSHSLISSVKRFFG